MFSLLYGPTLTSIHSNWKTHNFDKADLCWQSNVSAFFLNFYLHLFFYGIYSWAISFCCFSFFWDIFLFCATSSSGL